MPIGNMTAMEKMYRGQVYTYEAIAIADNIRVHPIVRTIDGCIFV